MKLKEFIKDNIIFIILNLVLALSLAIFLLFVGVKVEFIVLLVCVWICPISILLLLQYLSRRKYYNNLFEYLDSLDKKYLLTEVISEPEFIDGKLLYEVIKITDRDMHEKIKELDKKQKEYREYIETWVHEVKTPISSSKLIIENNKNSITNSINDELSKIEEYVEQVLYYARSNDANKDYIVKKLNLEGIIKKVISKNSKDFIHKKIKLELENVDNCIYSDEKWAEFILNQILINSIKYCNKDDSKIKIHSVKEENNIILSIIDNGIGISEKDINKVFDKGFTGENGRIFGKSTGMGLYICNKLAEKLNIGIEIQSTITKGTEVKVIFPMNKYMILEK